MVLFQLMKDLISCREDVEDSFRVVFNLTSNDESIRQPLKRVLKILLRAVNNLENTHSMMDLCFDKKYSFVYGT